MKPTDKKQLKIISILICSKNRRPMLESLVEDLQHMNSGYFVEIVVVEETDCGEPISGVKYVPHPAANRGIGYARNIALEHANGDIILFIDDDCKVPQGWLDKLIKPLQEDESVLGVQGGVTVPEQSNIIGWAETLLGFPGGGLKRILEARGKWQETENVSTLNCAYRKNIVDQIGGFDERLIAGSEDYLLAKMVCQFGRCIFTPEAAVAHEPRGSLRKIWKWFVTRGRADIELIHTKKLNQEKLSNLVKGSLLVKVAGIAVFLFCTRDLGELSIILPLALLLYFLLQILRYYKVWRLSKCAVSVLLIIPVIKIFMDVAADCGRFLRLTNE